MVTQILSKPILGIALAVGFSNALFADVTWTGGSGYSNFADVTKYTPQPTSLGAETLIFDTPTNNSSLSISAAGNTNIGGLNIQLGGTGFTLWGATRALGINSTYGIVVDESTLATIYPKITKVSASEVNITVGQNGELTLKSKMSLGTAPFHKKGSGTLILEQGTDVVDGYFDPTRPRSAFYLEEGVVELLSGARIGWGPASAVLGAEQMHVALGTSSTAAVLQGQGNVDGHLVTAGTGRSTIAPTGTLTIHTLDASEGATFNFTLGETLLQGAGALTGSTAANGLAINFTGGEAGQIYTLFDYENLQHLENTDFQILTDGYVLDASFGTQGWLIQNGTVQVRFEAIPEPSTVSILGLVGGGALLSTWLRKRTGSAREQD